MKSSKIATKSLLIMVKQPLHICAQIFSKNFSILVVLTRVRTLATFLEENKSFFSSITVFWEDDCNFSKLISRLFLNPQVSLINAKVHTVKNDALHLLQVESATPRRLRRRNLQITEFWRWIITSWRHDTRPDAGSIYQKSANVTAFTAKKRRKRQLLQSEGTLIDLPCAVPHAEATRRATARQPVTHAAG